MVNPCVGDNSRIGVMVTEVGGTGPLGPQEAVFFDLCLEGY